MKTKSRRPFQVVTSEVDDLCYVVDTVVATYSTLDRAIAAVRRKLATRPDLLLSVRHRTGGLIATSAAPDSLR